MRNLSRHSTVTSVAEDVYQIRLPLPFRLDHVHSYLLRERNGWTVVDFGLRWPDAEATWREALTLLNVQPAAIHKLVLTHMHPDHFGMAGWFQSLSGCPVLVSRITSDQIKQIWFSHAWAPNKVTSWWDDCGVPDKVSRDAAERVEYLRDSTFPHPTHMTLLEPDSKIELGGRLFRPIHAPGHADGQLLFYSADERLIFSGDQVLMKITPNIGAWPTGAANPLQNYLDSLRSLRRLNIDSALPGHGGLIVDWCGRIDEIITHHDVRLNRTLQACEKSATVFDVAHFLFDMARLSPHEIRFAVAETRAHLEYLLQQGKLKRTLDSPHLFTHA